MQFTAIFSVVAYKEYLDKDGKTCRYIQLLYVSDDKTSAELKGYKMADTDKFKVGDKVKCACEYNRYGLRVNSVTVA